MTRFLPCPALCVLFFLAACDSADPEPEPVPLDVQTATDIEADVATGRDPTTGQGISSNLFTLYDLEAGRVVLSSNETAPDVRERDSASTAWDIGFRGTTIIFNGGTSGPGEVEAQLLAESFAEVAEAPEGGYVADGQNECPVVETQGGSFPGQPHAVCTGSDNGWYNYNEGLITPLPGRTIVLRTADGNYAKLRILSYYRGNPATPGGDGRYYTFEYVLQEDGSRDFTETTAGT